MPISVDSASEKQDRTTRRGLIRRLQDAFEFRFGSLEGQLDNPFILRTIRKDNPRWCPFGMLAIPAAFTLIAYVLLFHFYTPAVVKSTKIPLGLLLTIVSGLAYGSTAQSVAQGRSTLLLAYEVQHGTLEQLLLLPMKRSELLFKMAVHPFLLGMLVALSGLPFFLIAVICDGISLIELISLYILFAMLCFTPPSLGLQALSKSYASASSEARKDTKKTTQTSSSWWSFLWVFVQFFHFFRGLGRWIATQVHRPISALAAAFLPFTIYSPFIYLLLPFGWHILVAMTMVRIAPFYRIALPPILLILPFYLWSRLDRLMLIGEQAEDSVEPSRMRMVIGRARVLAIWGFLWNPVVISGGLSWLASTSRVSIGWSQAGLLYLLMAPLMAVLFYRTLTTSLEMDRSNERLIINHIPLRWYLAPAGGTAITYFGMHLLGWTWPFSPEVWEMAKRVLLGLAAILPFAYGLRQLGFALEIRAGLIALRAGGVDSPRVEHRHVPAPVEKVANGELAPYVRIPLALLGWTVVLITIFPPFLGLVLRYDWVWEAAAVSPISAILAVSPASTEFLESIRPGYGRPLPSLEQHIVLQCAIGLIMLAIARFCSARAIPRKLVRTERGSRVSSLRNSRLMAPIVAAIRRIDNPILTHQLRLGMRNGRIMLIAALGLVPYALFGVFTCAPISEEIPRGFAEYIYGISSQSDGALPLGMLALVLSGGVLSSLLIPAMSICEYMRREVERSTLPFLLMTCMSDREIAMGIALSHATPQVAALIIAIPMILMLGLLCIPCQLGITALTLICVFGMLVGSSVLYSVAVGTLFANQKKIGDMNTFVLVGIAILAFLLPWLLRVGDWAIGWPLGYSLIIFGLGMLIWRFALRRVHRRRTRDIEPEGQFFAN